MTPKEGDTIVVWFSCGAASAIALQQTIDRYPQCQVKAVNNPVAEEDVDNRRFLQDVANWLNIDIETAINPRYPECSAVKVWDDRQFMSGPKGAPCTLELKKRTRQIYEMDHDIDFHVLGFTLEEKKRYENFIASERNNTLPVLINENITKQQCYELLREAGLSVPRVYKQGYPNANCLGCVKATSPTYWNHVRQVHPDVFDARAVQSRAIGAKLVRHKGERIYLDQLPANAEGRPMKNLDFECGIFCEKVD